MNEQADNTQIAADLAAAEAEQTAASAAAVTEAPSANAPLRGVRAQVVEMVNQVKSLSQQLEQERTEREVLAAQLAEARGKHPISAQTHASPSAGVGAVETVAITPGKDTAAMPVADQAAPAVAPA